MQFMVQLPPIITKWLKSIIDVYKEIESIWLIGSRANNTYNNKSDWDFLFFANEFVLNDLTGKTHYNIGEIDMLIVYNEKLDFKCPWLKNGKVKKGNLHDWQWAKESASQAIYLGNKWINGHGVESFQCIGKKIWDSSITIQSSFYN